MNERLRLLIEKASPYLLYWRPLYILLSGFTFFRTLLSRGRPALLYPAIESSADYHAAFRASFYFPDNSIEILGRIPAQEDRPDYFGHDVKISSRINIISHADFFLRLLAGRPVLVWHKRNWLTRLVALMPNSTDACFQTKNNEGWNYFKHFNLLNAPRQQHFDFSSFRGKGKSLVVGTGPSADEAATMDCSTYDVIICNTIVKNLPFCDHLKPVFLVFADAVYHFGPSIYANAFRDALRIFLQAQPQCHVLIPESFYSRFIRDFEEFSSRIFSIAMADDRRINVDFRIHNKTHRIDNILNFLLAPLAATISNEIAFIGFDGRKATDKGFWSHSASNNFNELLPYQQLAHPSFFYHKDLELYAQRQAINTETIFRAIESAGKTVYSLNSSTNSAMNDRYRIHQLT